jgi:hypothetical protein
MSSRVAPVHGAQGTDIILKWLGVQWNTSTLMGIKLWVAVTPLVSLLQWTAGLRVMLLMYGLLLRNLKHVARSSVRCALLNPSFSRIKRMLGMHLWLRLRALSRSRPMWSLIKLKCLICQSRSVFGALPGATSTTPSHSLTRFTWNQVPLVDFKLSSR